MSEQQKPPKDLPQIDQEGRWTKVVDGITYRFHEAKLRERRDARNQALEVSPLDPQIEEQARLLGMICERQTADGWEPVPFTEILERGETFGASLYQTYALGLVAVSLKLRNFSELSKPGISASQRSETSVRP